MEQVQTPEVAAFGELNKRMGVLISNTVQQKFGTPEERKFMTALTDAGLESAEEMIVLINEGLTYEIWKEFLDRKNSLDGPLGLFENEAGDMAAIIEEFRGGDFRAVFEQFKTEGVFTVKTVEQDIQLLKGRKEWAEQMWGREDQHTKAAEVLAQVAKETVDADDTKQNDVLELVKQMDADTHNELVRHGDPEFIKQLDEAAQAKLTKGSDQ